MVFVLAFCANLAFAQTQTVSGIVKSTDSGEPLPGVAIVEKGTNNGTVTNFEGKFDIKLKSLDAILVFSSMGMQTKEVKASAGFMVVNLALETAQLEEVVVTALGITREKKSLGYAVSNLNSEELSKSGEQDVIRSLNAKVPGLQVVSTGGTPGSSSKMLIRGAATISGENQPLIVIDGIPIDNTTTQSSPRDYPFNANLAGVNNSNRAVDINPDDIESVTVLKGPAAAALYGERAGNGAIIYTTKRGRGGKQGLGVNVSSSVEFTQVNQLPEKQNKYAAGTGGGVTPNVQGTFIAPADPGPDGIGGTDDDVALGTPNSWGPSLSSQNLPAYDAYDFFQTGIGWKNGIEVTGGNENSSVRLSIGDLRQTGIVPNSSFNRTSVRLTGDTKLSNKVQVGGTMNYIKSSQVAVQNGSNVSGVMLGLIRTPASYNLEPYTNTQGFNRNYFYAYDNPYYTAYENPFTSNVNRLMGNVFLNYQISEAFKFSYRLGTDFYSDNRKQIYAISARGADIPNAGQVNQDRINSTELYGDGILTYTNKLTEKLTLNARLGHNFRINKYDDLFGRGRMLTIPNFYNMNNASDLYTSNFTTEVRSQAIFGELDFDYGGFLYVNFTGRNEWSSTFELDNNSFFYPSASVSFVFSEVWEMPEWLSFGKVRYGYAQVGISPQAYATRPIYTSPSYTDGFTDGLSVPYNGVNGFAVSNTLFSADLKPERQTGNEVGINLNFLKGLFDIDYTYYNQKSTDLLMFLPVPASSGFTSSYTNVGELVNQGHEIYLTVNPIRKEEFKWSISLSWTKNTSEVTKLGEGIEEVSVESAFTSIGSFAIVGEPLGVFYGTAWQRDANGNKLIGANGRPIIAAEQGNIGSPLPNWFAGLRNTFEYKNFNFIIRNRHRHLKKRKSSDYRLFTQFTQ